MPEKKRQRCAVRLRGKTKRAARQPKVPFGVFEFDEFAGWMLQQYLRCSEIIDAGTVRYPRLVLAARLSEFEVPAFARLHAADTAYLAILALGLQYSLGEDLVDGCTNTSRFLLEEGVERAAKMLRYHARYLPAKLGRTPEERSPLQRRATMVGAIYVPIAFCGFDQHYPPVATLAKGLPKPVRGQWRRHEHGETALCQLMIVTFAQAFRYYVPPSQENYWAPVLKCFWKDWECALLTVYTRIYQESLWNDRDE